MTRAAFIERTLRQVYGGYIPDDSEITFLLVNNWMTDGIGLAAQQCYKGNVAIDGIGYINNGFYTTFRGIAISPIEQFTYRVTLPEIPVGIGRVEGTPQLRLVDGNNISLSCIPMSENQSTFVQTMRPVQNKTLYKPEGKFIYIYTTLILTPYTANVTMISGGDSTDLDSELNVPPDYLPVITEYVKQQLLVEQSRPKDTQNDGNDIQTN